MAFEQLASEESIQKVVDNLKKNGIEAEVVENGEQAKQEALSLIPQGAEVFAYTSETLRQIGVMEEIDESGRYNSVRKQLSALDRATQARQMQKLGAAPDYAIGSVHAITEDGKIFIASNTGSQLPGDAYAAGKVIWVVGTQKIVKDNDQALKRIYEHVLPLESVRLNKQYNTNTGSYVSKLLIINREFPATGRVKVILVKEKLGF